MGLGYYGEKADNSLPVLKRALRDRKYQIRETAAKSLLKIGAKGTPAIPDLIEALNDEQGSVRRPAAEALGNFGSAAKDAIPALMKMSEQSDFLGGRAIALDAIAKIRGERK